MARYSKPKRVPKETTELELSKTRQILWRFSKVEKNVSKKRTTFSELFFDLAVVFIFALLAARLMGSIGQSVFQIEAHSKSTLGLPTTVIDTKNHWIGFFFWMVHFLALWFTWYQFSNYTKYHWIDNMGNNVLTLGLIFTLILQGAGIYFTNESLANYSLLTSFILARLIFATAQFIAIHNSPIVPISKELMIKTKRQSVILAGTVILFLIYILVTRMGYLDTITNKDATNPGVTYDRWKKDLFIICILAYHFLARFTWKIFGSRKLTENTYSIVFHTKERHHLFIIIALGELLVVTLTSSFINNQDPSLGWDTISYMFITPFIAMAIWYVYKTVFYKATPERKKRNYYLYLICHVVLVFGILVFLGSMKSHMQADAFHRTIPFKDIDQAVIQASRTYYSLGIVVGLFMIVSSIAVYACFATFKQVRWGKVIKALSPILIAKAIIVLAWLITEITLFAIDIQVPFSTVIYTALALEIFFAFLLVWKSQRVIIKQFDTVADFDTYSAKLDK